MAAVLSHLLLSVRAAQPRCWGGWFGWGNQARGKSESNISISNFQLVEAAEGPDAAEGSAGGSIP
ncbi:hypothetical protein, partial [Caballeronia sp.]|uniref:hypothetical protein n=1 Tax=Caballeronia sp. TaxID=1931223 RepID=UPI003C4E9938